MAMIDILRHHYFPRTQIKAETLRKSQAAKKGYSYLFGENIQSHPKSEISSRVTKCVGVTKCVSTELPHSVITCDKT